MTNKIDKYKPDDEGYYVEVKDDVTGFKFRLRKGRRTSPWGLYTDIIKLDDRFAVTEAYAGFNNGAYTPITQDQVNKYIGIVE